MSVFIAIINQKKDGMVYIDISSNSEVCMITISDNGDGIQDCDIAGIFDRFMSRKSQDEFHAGIGLNLSKLITLINASKSQPSSAYIFLCLSSLP